MGRTLITNCPNCGAALERDGSCKYCGAHVRYANELDIDTGDFYNAPSIEISLNVKKGDAITVLLLRGHIEEISTRTSVMESPIVDLKISGYIIPQDKED